MSWKPISEKDIHYMIDVAWEGMSVSQRRLWDAVRIMPEKWHQHPWGDLGGGFWAVAILGRTVVWYNDIEDGFNISQYATYGEIDEYWCNQDELELAMQKMLNVIATGHDVGQRVAPPKPVS